MPSPTPALPPDRVLPFAPKGRGGWGARVFALLSFFTLSACSAERACYEGDFRACTCDDGRPGFAACDAANDAYGACGSCGQVPGLVAPSGGGGQGGASGGSGGSGGSAGSGGTSKHGFLEPCEKDEDCESGLCHTFPSKGPHCTLPCQTSNDCPLPSPGCNPMGVCKVP